MRDAREELTLGDKIYVVKGELQQAYGPVANFKDGGLTLSFRPSNIEGFDDLMDIDRGSVVKFFDKGDRIRVVGGKYQSEVGTVVSIDDDNVSMPRIKLDRTDIEVVISTYYLKNREERDTDEFAAII